MELAAQNKLSAAQHYSPTSTPVLDVFRPLPPQTKENLSAGEYFLVSSLVILSLLGLPRLRTVIETMAVYWVVLIPVVAALATGLIHEAGHLVAAWFAGFKFKQFKLGGWRMGGHAKCREPYCGDVLAFGFAVLEPRMAGDDAAHLRRKLWMVYSGGPLANLICAAAFEFSVTMMQLPLW